MTMKMLLVLAAALLGGSGCVTLSTRAQRVSAVTDAKVVDGCQQLGEVNAPPPYLMPGDAETKLRNAAAELGGNVVLMEMGIGSAKGHAYRCQP